VEAVTMPRSVTPHRQLITVDAAASYLGIGVRSVRRYIAEQKLPAYRVGDKLIRVDQADVDALIRPFPAAQVR
jgi:excisionase family DNA binding protein